MKAVGPSGLSPLACLFLEARLNQWQPEQPTKLYNRNEASKDKELWLQLAMMYQGMEEYDVVHGIFHDVMRCKPNVKEALEFERSGQWTKGKTAFSAILSTWSPGSMDNETEYIERDYYYEGYFKCFEKLSQWSDLNKVVMNQLENSFQEAWNDEAFWIPWLMKSQVNSGLELERNPEDFFKYITNIDVKDRRMHLQSAYSRELAIIHSMFEEYNRARVFVQKYYDSFLEDWPHLSSLSPKIKAPKLLNTQLTSELSLFLSVMKSQNSHQVIKDFQRLCSMWRVNLPNQMESLSHWEHRIACRHFFIGKMIAADVGGETHMAEESIDLRLLSAQMALSLVDTAISAHNFHIADKYLKKSEKVLKDHSDSALILPWHISQAFLPWVRGINSRSNSSSQLSLYVKAWNSLVAILHEAQLPLFPEMQLNVIQKIYTISKTVYRVMKMNSNIIDNLDQSIKMDILKLIGDPVTSTSSLKERIIEYGIHQLQKSVSIAHEALSKNHIADQYLELAKYCQYVMEDTTEKYDETIIKAILRAMAHGSQEARQWFPCILQLPDLHSSFSELFRTESSRVPTWMYLSWTSQLLAHLNNSSCLTLSDLIIRMGETYPSAIALPFQVSSDKYQKEMTEDMRTLINRLQKILFQNGLLANMLKSLAYVCVPEVMLDHHLVKIASLLQSPNPIQEEVEKAKTTMMSEVFPTAREKRSNSIRYHGSLIGTLQQYKMEICNTLSGLLLANKGHTNAVTKKLRQIREKFKYKSSKWLQDYSEWLSEFRFSGHGEYIEIPGQYNGEVEPRLEEHVKIVGFLPKVTVMASLRRPICITILGSDAKEHKFLVKYGEDLRLDQRVEQLFGIMNKLLAVNAVTSERRLNISTYQVIPITNSLGIIEWVENTRPLLEMLLLPMGDEGKMKRNMAYGQYERWIEMARQKSNPLDTDIYLKYRRSETIIKFEERVALFPCDLLRRSLLRLSLSYDSFWSLRNEFATSYATVCIAHWLLGIGDRHLQNMLVSMTTGRVVGIDFGYSFGTATQFLLWPELIPFRLTPQIIGLMQPFGEVGLMKETMIHTLRALQENHQILLATMDVFIKEPSVDWLEAARKQAKVHGITASELEDYDLMYPKKKISLIRQKFVDGINPREITLKELDSRKMDKSELLRKFKEIATGDPKHNIRATLPPMGLSCEQQVSCLIDQATDYHLLGKTYKGIQPWL